MDAGIYNRVSTAQQLDNFSLDEQSRLNREYAARNGMTVVKEVTVDESASDLFRIGLDGLLQLIEARKIQALIVYGSDRLSRSTVDGLLLLEALAKSGVELHYSTRGKVENTPEHRILHAIEFSMNEYWKFKLLQALRRGKEGKLREGLFLGQGPTPYGYTRVGARREAQLVINEEEAEVVRQIFHWYVIDDWGIHQIGRELDARGVPTYAAKYRREKGKKATYTWTESVVRAILAKELYTGVFTYNTLKRKDFYDPEQKRRRSHTIRVPEDAIKIPIPAIIDRGLWEQAQQKTRSRRSRRNENKGPREFLLRTRVRCGLCDHVAIPKIIKTASRDKPYRYYRCSEREGHQGPNCWLPMFRADVVDSIVWEYVRELLLNPGNIESGLRQSKQGAYDANEKTRQLIAATEALIAKQEEALTNVLSLRIESTNSVTIAHLAKMQQDIERVLENLTERREGLMSELVPEVDIETTLETVRTFQEQMEQGMLKAETDFETRKQIVAYLQTQAVLTIEDGEKTLYLSCIIDRDAKRYNVRVERLSPTHTNS